MNKKNVLYRIVSFVLMLCVGTCSLAGCGRQKEPLSVQGFAFNTTYSITAYQGGSQDVLDRCIELCGKYDRLFSRTRDDSPICQINEIEKLCLSAMKEHENAGELCDYIEKHKNKENSIVYRLGKGQEISFRVEKELADLVKAALEYGEKSQGKFDISVEPVSSQWDFSGENPKVPQKETIADALERVNYQSVSVEGEKIILGRYGMGLDLGGIAKGYVADRIKDYLKKQGVKSGMINLGGNVLCVGDKQGDSFSIGIQKPFGDRNEVADSVKVKDKSVVSSGIYERYFEEAGKMYHHILDIDTGFPIENDLVSITIVSDKSVDGDALSTTCFSMGGRKAMEYIDSLEDTYGMAITRDGEILYSEGMKKLM